MHRLSSERFRAIRELSRAGIFAGVLFTLCFPIFRDQEKEGKGNDPRKGGGDGVPFIVLNSFSISDFQIKKVLQEDKRLTVSN